MAARHVLKECEKARIRLYVREDDTLMVDMSRCWYGPTVASLLVRAAWGQQAAVKHALRKRARDRESTR